MFNMKHIRKTVVGGILIGSMALGNQAFAATYQVKSGDSLWKVSQKFSTTVQQLKTMNHLDSNTIYPGQRLEVNSETYTVRKGDTLNKIAAKYAMSLSNLLEQNQDITNPNLIYPGQTIKVASPASATNQSSAHSVVEATSTNTPSSTAPTSIMSTSTASTTSKVNQVINEGEKFIGAKYVYGASVDRTDAFDCSSLTKKAYSVVGIDLPRTSREQAQMGTPVSRSNIQPGDLVFFDTNGDGVINHVGIYIGNNKMLSATSSHGVMISDMTYYWNPRFVTARRIIS